MKDADMLEGVQRKTKRIPSLRNFSYEERLKTFGMFSIRGRKLWDDTMEMFKMIHDIDMVSLQKLF